MYNEDRIIDLETKLEDMMSDFAKCAKGASPCFFCVHDDVCNGFPENCNFVWNPHN